MRAPFTKEVVRAGYRAVGSGKRDDATTDDVELQQGRSMNSSIGLISRASSAVEGIHLRSAEPSFAAHHEWINAGGRASEQSQLQVVERTVFSAHRAE
jgi:hypothetical protein